VFAASKNAIAHRLPAIMSPDATFRATRKVR
jgi:hypothetical protein